jgi:aryl-alcohol dehydrogenase-like predicted oxidoreductase
MSLSHAAERRTLGNSDLQVSACCLGGMTWGDQNTAAEAAAQLSMAHGDFGVNFIDTAEAYPVPLSPNSQGKTDECIARWMAESSIPRDDIVLSTKVCGYSDRYTWLRESGEGTRLTREQIFESVDASLARLKTDHIDVLQFHWPERSVGLTRGSTRGAVMRGTAVLSEAGGAQSEAEEEVGGEAADTERVKQRSRGRGAEPILSQVESIGELIRAGKIRHWGLSNENPEGVAEFLRCCETTGV